MVQCMIGFANFKVWQILSSIYVASQVALVVKNLPADAGDVRDTDLISGSGKSPGEGNGNPFQYSI